MQVNRGLFIALVVLIILAAGVWLWFWHTRRATYRPVEVPIGGAPTQPQVPNQPQKATPQGL
ncbi:hypothetical protein HRbin17_00063 [bacterium HR17]|uniref:Uncharacterized protein n=1 Tax=Candidatus Fervidibacter japonicus TaxID=2035412 RepID=A0A2H5X8R0_9BACT|nr:hypothetical protein HRbin17_00063 [bacterium HR17]